MNRNSKNEKALLIAVDKGYKICEKGIVTNKKEIEVKGYLNNVGYKVFSLRWDKNNISMIPFHRLQAYQKFGDVIFKKDIVCRHKNNNRMDNTWYNILIGTQQMNLMDNPKEDRIKYATNASRASNPRTEKERFLIYEDIYNGMSYNKIMKKHNVSSKGTLSFMKNKSEEYKKYCEKYPCVGKVDKQDLNSCVQ